MSYQDNLRGAKLHPTIGAAWVADIGVSRQTGRDYLAHLGRFQRRLDGRRGDVRAVEVTAEDVRDYVELGDDGAARADRTRAHILGILYGVFAWASDPDLEYRIVGNPAARLRSQRTARRNPRDRNRRVWLAEAQARALVATTRGDGSDPLDQRDATMIVLYLYTGLRLSELIRVRWAQVDFAAAPHGALVQVARKGGKVVDVPLNEAARRELFAWRARFVEAVGPDIAGLGIIPQTRSTPAGGLTAVVPCANSFRAAPGKRKAADRRAACPKCGKVVRIKADGRLWEHGTRPGTDRGRELSIVWRQRVTAGVTVRDRIAKRAAAAGIAHLRPHDLRRSYAGILEDRGAPLQEIQEALGHAHSITTERYLKQRTRLAPAAAELDFG